MFFRGKILHRLAMSSEELADKKSAINVFLVTS